MNILHIAKISNKKANGVNVVVPEHILAQAVSENVYFYNLKDIVIEGLEGKQIFHKLDNNFAKDVKEKYNIDIVIFHEVNNIENITIYKQLLKLNIPYVVVPHGEIRVEALNKKWLKKKVAYMLLFNSFIRKANAVQCLSNAEKNDIKIKLPKTFVVGNGVNKPQFSKQSFSIDEVKMIFIGRIEVHVKGLDLLFEALDTKRALLEKYNVNLNIYGPDLFGRGDEVRALITKYNLNKFVSLNPPVFNEDKQKVFLDSDIFIQTSRHEGMPAGILEAMSYGLPCIVTKGTSLSDVIVDNDAGYYAGQTAEEIAEAIEKAVLDRDNWAIKGKNGIKAIEQNFLWKKIAKKELEEYKKMTE